MPAKTVRQSTEDEIPKTDILKPSMPLLPDPPRVDVYRNLTHGCLSVKCKAPGHPMYDKIIAHAEHIKLMDVDFVYYDAKQEQALEEEKRNVHAFARGFVSEVDGNSGEFPNGDTRITYKLFDDDYPNQFSTVDGRPVEGVNCLFLSTDDGVTAEGIRYK